MEIINKYRMRGFGTILNKKSKQNYLSILVIMNFGEIYNINVINDNVYLKNNLVILLNQ